MKNFIKALLALLVVGLVASGILYRRAAEIENESAKQRASDAEIVKKVNDEWRPKLLAQEDESYQRKLKRASDELEENKKDGNRIAAEQLYETKLARLKQEHAENVTGINAKYK